MRFASPPWEEEKIAFSQIYQRRFGPLFVLPFVRFCRSPSETTYPSSNVINDYRYRATRLLLAIPVWSLMVMRTAITVSLVAVPRLFSFLSFNRMEIRSLLFSLDYTLLDYEDSVSVDARKNERVPRCCTVEIIKFEISARKCMNSIGNSFEMILKNLETITASTRTWKLNVCLK